MAALLDRALEFALTKAGRDSQFRLKPEQKEIIEALLFKKDVLGVLPTGFGKTLVFHLLSDVFDFEYLFISNIYVFLLYFDLSYILYFFNKILFSGRFPEQVYAVEDLFQIRITATLGIKRHLKPQFRNFAHSTYFLLCPRQLCFPQRFLHCKFFRAYLNWPITSVFIVPVVNQSQT